MKAPEIDDFRGFFVARDLSPAPPPRRQPLPAVSRIAAVASIDRRRFVAVRSVMQLPVADGDRPKH